MKLQQLLSVTRKAVDEFQMIQEGDKIAVGVSGGKRQPYTSLCPSRELQSCFIVRTLPLRLLEIKRH